MQVEIDCLRGSAGPLELVMSRSSPGRYALHEFAKNVFDVRATDGTGRALDRRASGPARVARRPPATAPSACAYRVYGDRVDGTYLAIDPTHAHINIPAALMWVRGLESRPATIVIVPPDGSGWRVATQLFPTADPWTFTAPNLAVPDGQPDRGQAGTSCAPSGRRSRRAQHQARRCRSACTRRALPRATPTWTGSSASSRRKPAVFGEYPPFEGGGYTFLADYLPWASATGWSTATAR